MALLLKDAPALASQSEKRKQRKTVLIEADERSLVSPLALRRPAGRLLYWLVFALLQIGRAHV